MKLTYTHLDVSASDWPDDVTFCGRMRGHPHPEGEYTGEMTYSRDDGQWWHSVMDAKGNVFETTDAPVIVIDLTDMAHEEFHVKSNTGETIYAASVWPEYMKVKAS